MSEVWSIMTANLGVPPRPNEQFTWDYYDKDNKPKTWTGTPLEFFKEFSSKKYQVRKTCPILNRRRSRSFIAR